MKYIGNKTRLIPFIENCLKDSNIDYYNKKVVDLFSGTGSVSEFFLKNNCYVQSCDNMNYSIVEQYRKLYFRDEPKFYELKDEIGSENLIDVLSYLNNLNGVKGYFYENYCVSGKYNRNYFKNENGMKIDAIRNKIEQWKEILPDNKYFFLIGILVHSADFVANIAGTYGAYLKIWRSMALKDLKLETPNFIKTGEIELNVEDVIKFTKKMNKVDIVYLDPPYNTRQYAAYFHVLENITVYDKKELKGKTGMRDYDNQKSKFSMKPKVLEEFRKLINQINSNYIILSYSTEGILNVDDIEKVLKEKGILVKYDMSYRRFKTNSWTEKHTNLKELLFVLKVDK